MEHNRIFHRILMESRNFRQRISDSESESEEIVRKENLKEEELDERKNQISINPWTINNFIIEFFIINGLQEAALEFIKETGTQNYNINDINNDKLNLMAKIRKSILMDNIESTIELLNQFNPDILIQNEEIHFELLSIRLFELLDYQDLNKVIIFIKKEMIPVFRDSSLFLSKIENFMGEIMIKKSKENFKFKLKNKNELILIINNSLQKYFNNFNYSSLEILVLLNEFFENKTKEFYDFKPLKYDI